MHPEINAQTIEDIGKHSNYLWGVVGSLLTAVGFALKAIGSAIFNKWVCMQKEIDEMKSELKVKDTEYENIKIMVHDLREEVHGYRKEVRDEFQILHRRVDAHIEKGGK
jgi:hypothetical protein